MRQSKRESDAEEARDQIVFRKLTSAIESVACAIREAGSNEQQTRAILERITHMETNVMIKVSEIKVAVAELKKNNAEALGEIGTQIADLKKQIDDLIAGVGDPTVTDEAFETDLREAGASAKALAGLVPGTPTPPTP